MIFAITVERTIVFSLILAIGFAVAKTAVIKREFMPDPRPAHHEGSVACNDFLFHLRKLYSIRHFDNVALIGVSIVFHVVASLLMFVLARLLIPSQDKDRVFQFRFIFGNTGFMGIPLSCERVQGAGVSRPRRAP